jgi:uroporphyrinogen III methyltransferase/synthase
VIYDYLANARLLEHAPATAERILVEKHGGGRSVEQAQINALLLEHARQGKAVVRLKGGDPFVFGRGGEEAEALAAAGIPFEIVPGVTSVVAVPAYAGIPLTHRDLSSSVTVCTGYEYPDKREMAVHWDAVARRGGTLVLLMTTRQLRQNMARLMAHGVSADTPVAVIRWGTLAEQETLVGTAGTIAQLAQERGLQPPALAVVGDVVRLRERLNWYEKKPLFGRRVIVTRPRAQAAVFIDLLTDAGAEAIPCPTIEIVPPPSWGNVDAALKRVEEFNWVIFTSANGVEVFFQRLSQLGRDLRVLHRARLAAVGPQTARALGERGLLVDVVPREFRAEAVAEAIKHVGVRGAKILLPRAAGAREILPAMLREAGAFVEEVATYQTVPAPTDTSAVRSMLQEGRVDLVTFTSSSTVRNFVALLGEDALPLLARTIVGCIGPITADTARELGLDVMIQPVEYTIPAFAKAIIEHFAGSDQRKTSST